TFSAQIIGPWIYHSFLPPFSSAMISSPSSIYSDKSFTVSFWFCPDEMHRNRSKIAVVGMCLRLVGKISGAFCFHLLELDNRRIFFRQQYLENVPSPSGYEKSSDAILPDAQPLHCHAHPHILGFLYLILFLMFS